MKKLILTFIFLLSLSYSYSQDSSIDQTKIKEDLDELINDLSESYVYLTEKNVDLDCISAYYEAQIPAIKTKEGIVLFFEYLLDEFYDSHVHLNTAYSSSYRLYSPMYVSIKDKRIIVSNIWQTQIEGLEQNIVGAELLEINGIDINSAINQFPTHCNDKTDQNVREWIANKLLAGRYNEARMLTLKLGDKDTVEFDLDKLKIKPSTELLRSSSRNDIGIIRINNSLGNNKLINEFDRALDDLMNTEGLIIDLRNTVDGGNSYVARGIMGRFISKAKPYQKHLTSEQYGGNPMVERSWVEMVSPREKQYKNPVVVLVGRWTGSMGEGLAIGFEGMERAQVVGSQMERLAGEINGFSFKHQNFGYSLSTAKLHHINGTPREKYVPTNYIEQTTIQKDEFLEKGIELINGMTE